MFAVVGLAIILIVSASFVVARHKEDRGSAAQVEYFGITKVDDEELRMSKLEEFAEKYKGMDVALQALMLLGEESSKKSDFEKAVEYYTRALEESKGKQIYFVAVDALGRVYVDMGRFGDAVDLYLKTAEVVSNPWPYLSKYQAASVYELSGDNEKAVEIYNSLISDVQIPASVKLKAEEQLLWLSASR